LPKVQNITPAFRFELKLREKEEKYLFKKFYLIFVIKNCDKYAKYAKPIIFYL